MTSTSFDREWSVRPKASIFQQLRGSVDPGTAVRLPHDALIGAARSPEHGAPHGFFPDGVFEYRKDFDTPEEWRDRRVAVEFGGVYRDAVVFVNDAAVAQRPYGYSGFVAELSPYLRIGERNSIRVEARTHDDSRWYPGVGIYRSTTLHVTDLVHLAHHGVRITTPDVDAERAVVDVAVEVRNDSHRTRAVSVEVQLHDGEGRELAERSAPMTLLPGSTATARIRSYLAAPALWSVDDARMHAARVAVREDDRVLDEREVGFGVRTLRLDPVHGLRINGEPVKLRGACVHHDNGILGTAAFGRAEERKIEQLKAAGFNAIRSSHHTLSEAMLDACDRHGMLVMDEAFDVWTESKSSFDYSLAFAEWWERDLEAMVGKDFNHPSVIFYSIGNEIPETGDRFGAVWGRRLAEKVRELDPTRYVTNGINGLISTIDEVGAMLEQMRGETQTGAINGINEFMSRSREASRRFHGSETVTRRTEESHAVLDVAGLNYGEVRYELDRELYPERIIIGTETFNRSIADNWRLVLENPQVLGDFTWTGYDYLGEAGVGRMPYDGEPQTFEAPYPWLTAWCGDLDLTGHRRPASYYREIVFGLRSDPYLAVHRPEHYHRTAHPGRWTWSDTVGSWTWAVEHGHPVVVDVYSDAEEVELFLDGELLGRERVGGQEAYVARFDTAYRHGELSAVAYRGGRPVGRTALRSAGGAVLLTAEIDRATIRADDADLWFVTIELRDEHGTVLTHERRDIEVEVTGAGELQALGSARPDNHEGFAGPRHSTFDGRVLAVVRPTGPGEATMTVRAEGLEPVVLRATAA